MSATIVSLQHGNRDNEPTNAGAMADVAQREPRDGPNAGVVVDGQQGLERAEWSFGSVGSLSRTVNVIAFCASNLRIVGFQRRRAATFLPKLLRSESPLSNNWRFLLLAWVVAVRVTAARKIGRGCTHRQREAAAGNHTSPLQQLPLFEHGLFTGRSGPREK